MSQEKLTCVIDLDMTAVNAKTSEANTRINWLNDKISTLMQRAKRATRATMSAITMTASAVISVLDLIPGALDPAIKAVIQAVITTIASLQAMAIAWYAGGVTAWLGIIVQSAAIGLGIGGLMAALRGQTELQAKFGEIRGALYQIGASATAWDRAAGAWKGD
jgi:hypothetical protein